MLGVVDTAIGRVGVELIPAVGLAEWLGGAHTTGGGVEKLESGLRGLAAADIPIIEPLPGAIVEGRVDLEVQVARPAQLTQDGGDTAGAVHILDVVSAVRRHLGQARYAVGDLVDVLEGEVHLALLGGGQCVEDGVGGTTHSHVQCHGIAEGFLGGDGARENGVVFLAVVASAQVHDGAASLLEKIAAGAVGSQRGAIARQGQAERLGEAVHGVGGEHAGAGTTGRAGGFLYPRQPFVGDGIAGRRRDGRNQIRRCVCHAVNDHSLAGLHRSTRYEDGGDVQTQRGIQHARGYLVAVGDAHQGIGSVGIDHVLDRIGDDLSRRQGIEHAAVAHGDAIVNSNGVELLRHAAGFADGIGHDVADVLEVDVAGNELGKGVGDGNDRLAEVTLLGAGRAPQRAGTRCLAANGGDFRAERVHG